MDCFVYYDESGDLGWELDKPYRNRGSSQYFTIAYLIVPFELNKHIQRLLRAFHRKRKGKDREYKGTEFNKSRAKHTARFIINNLLEHHPTILIGSTTIHKRTVPIRLKSKGVDHILYNHMVEEDICSKLTDYSKIVMVPDLRSVPSDSKNSAFDGIRRTMWMRHKTDIDIVYDPQESHMNDGLMLVDWIANFVWRKYENTDTAPMDILDKYLIEAKLHFK